MLGLSSTQFWFQTIEYLYNIRDQHLSDLLTLTSAAGLETSRSCENMNIDPKSTANLEFISGTLGWEIRQFILCDHSHLLTGDILHYNGSTPEQNN